MPVTLLLLGLAYGLLGVLAFFLLLYVSGFLHELGHALCGRLAGLTVTSFGLGLGRPFLVLGCGGVRVYLALRKPLQGVTFVVNPHLFGSRRQMVCLLSGGVLAHLVGTAAALALWRLFPGGWAVWVPVAAANAIFAVVNLVPMRFESGGAAFRSDGALILRELLRGGGDVPPGMLLQMVHQLRGLWEAVGDYTALQVFLTDAASVWALLGDVERARQLIDEAAALPLKPAPAFAAYLAAARGLVEATGGRPEAAADALDEAEKQFRELNNVGGQFLVRYWRTDLLLARGEAAEAVGALDDLADHPLVAARPWLRVQLLASRLAARAHLPDGEGVDDLRAEYEAVPARRRSPTSDVPVSRALLRYYLRKGMEEEARAAGDKACGALRQLARGPLNGADRDRVRRCLKRINEEVEAARGPADSGGGAGKREALPASPEGGVDDAGRPNRGPLLWGVALTLLNLVVCMERLTALVVSMPEGGAGPTPEAWVLSALVGYLGFCLSVSAVYAALAAALGRWLPALRRGLGRMLLVLALVPWVVWGGTLLAAVLTGWIRPGEGP